MVKTRAEVKLKIGEWIDKREDPFTTNEVREDIKPMANNIRLNPNRLTNFIRSTGKAEYDKSKKLWSRRIRV